MVNYLIELDLIIRLAPTSGKVKLGLSPKRQATLYQNLHEKLPYSHELYPYVQALIEQIHYQFYEP